MLRLAARYLGQGRSQIEGNVDGALEFVVYHHAPSTVGYFDSAGAGWMEVPVPAGGRPRFGKRKNISSEALLAA